MRTYLAWLEIRFPDVERENFCQACTKGDFFFFFFFPRNTEMVPQFLVKYSSSVIVLIGVSTATAREAKKSYY